jgi:hypothetical protein
MLRPSKSGSSDARLLRQSIISKTRSLYHCREHSSPGSVSLTSGLNSHRALQNAASGCEPQRCPILGRGVPKTAIAPTTSSQNGSTPTPGIASRTRPGKSSHCQPSTTNNSAAVTTSTAHPIGGAKLAKAPMTSDTPAMTKASASRNTENLRGVETVVSVDRFSNSEGAEGSDILTVALRLVGSRADDTPPSAPRNSKLCQL